MNKLILILALLIVFGCKYESQQSKKELVVCISFDDNLRSVYDNALPIMNQYGFRGTTYVNSGRIGYTKFCSWEQLTELKFDYHWEIGGHSLNHLHFATLTPTEVEYQISADFDSLSQHGFKPVSFATPFGECPTAYNPLVTKYYKNVRTTQNLPMHVPINKELLGSYWVGNNYSPKSLINRVTQGMADNENLVIFMFHDLKPENPTNNINNYDPEKFKQFLSGLHDMGVKVLPLNEALDYLED